MLRQLVSTEIDEAPVHSLSSSVHYILARSRLEGGGGGEEHKSLCVRPNVRSNEIILPVSDLVSSSIYGLKFEVLESGFSATSEKGGPLHSIN